MNIKKMIFIINLIVISIILASCTGGRDVNELGIIMSTGLDLEDGKIILTNEIMTPTSSQTSTQGKSENKVKYVQSSGDTIFEAYRNSTLIFDRKLYLSHNRVLIIGEEFAKRGIGDYINFYLYDTEPREATFMVVSKGVKAYEVMGINAGLSDTPGYFLQGMIENYEFTSKTRNINMNEYFKYYLERETPILGVVQKFETKEINKEQYSASNNKFVLDVTGGAAFKKDTLVGYYSGDEMIGFNFLVNEIQGGLIIFEVPDEFNKDVNYISTKGKYTVLEIISSKTKKEIEIKDGLINLSINVDLKGALGEESKGLMVTELKVLKAIQDACSAKVAEYISATMDKAQKEFKLDSFGINSLFHRKYPEKWKEVSGDWETIFPEINYKVNVETNILRTGLINVPTNIGKEEE